MVSLFLANYLQDETEKSADRRVAEPTGRRHRPQPFTKFADSSQEKVRSPNRHTPHHLSPRPGPNQFSPSPHQTNQQLVSGPAQASVSKSFGSSAQYTFWQ